MEKLMDTIHRIKINYMADGRWVVVKDSIIYRITNTDDLVPDRDHNRIIKAILSSDGKAIFRGFF